MCEPTVAKKCVRMLSGLNDTSRHAIILTMVHQDMVNQRFSYILVCLHSYLFIFIIFIYFICDFNCPRQAALTVQAIISVISSEWELPPATPITFAMVTRELMQSIPVQVEKKSFAFIKAFAKPERTIQILPRYTRFIASS